MIWNSKPSGLVMRGEICGLSEQSFPLPTDTHNIDTLRNASNADLLVLPDEHVQPRANT